MLGILNVWSVRLLYSQNHLLLRKGNTPRDANGTPRTTGGLSAGSHPRHTTEHKARESTVCTDLSIHHLLPHLQCFTTYAHQAAQGEMFEQPWKSGRKLLKNEQLRECDVDQVHDVQQKPAFCYLRTVSTSANYGRLVQTAVSTAPQAPAHPSKGND